jgi:hypothetical protein
MKKRDLTGQVFGQLTVIEDAGRDKYKNVLWRCRCSCGNETIVVKQDLTRKDGYVRSCGCRNTSSHPPRNFRHGHTWSTQKKGCSSTYTSWRAMLHRCTDSNHDNYPNYGGRGVTVCERWLSFDNFLADMAPPTTVRRIRCFRNIVLLSDSLLRRIFTRGCPFKRTFLPTWSRIASLGLPREPSSPSTSRTGRLRRSSPVDHVSGEQSAQLCELCSHCKHLVTRGSVPLQEFPVRPLGQLGPLLAVHQFSTLPACGPRACATGEDRKAVD